MKAGASIHQKYVFEASMNKTISPLIFEIIGASSSHHMRWAPPPPILHIPTSTPPYLHETSSLL